MTLKSGLDESNARGAAEVTRSAIGGDIVVAAGRGTVSGATYWCETAARAQLRNGRERDRVR